MEEEGGQFEGFIFLPGLQAVPARCGARKVTQAQRLCQQLQQLPSLYSMCATHLGIRLKCTDSRTDRQGGHQRTDQRWPEGHSCIRGQRTQRADGWWGQPRRLEDGRDAEPVDLAGSTKAICESGDQGPWLLQVGRLLVWTHCNNLSTPKRLTGLREVLPTSCVALGKLNVLSEPQFPPLQNEMDNPPLTA